MNIRQPFVAGSFYPENPIILRKKIEYFISNVSLRERTNPKILIVPHAGYNYSGQVAAHAYKQLTYMKIKKVIVEIRPLKEKLMEGRYFLSILLGENMENYCRMKKSFQFLLMQMMKFFQCLL